MVDVFVVFSLRPRFLPPLPFYLVAVFQQLFLNYVTELAHDDVFARFGRRFTVAKWASDALQAGNGPLR